MYSNCTTSSVIHHVYIYVGDVTLGAGSYVRNSSTRKTDVYNVVVLREVRVLTRDKQ